MLLNTIRIRTLFSALPQPDAELLIGVPDSAITALSEHIRLPIPDDLRTLLRFMNAPYIDGQVLLGIHPEPHRDIATAHSLYPTWHAAGWIPIGADGCGNYYMIASSQVYGAGWPIFFVEPLVESRQPSYVVASNIDLFIQFLIERELGYWRWPFDRQQLLQRDPSIVEFGKLKLPWEV